MLTLKEYIIIDSITGRDVEGAFFDTYREAQAFLKKAKQESPEKAKGYYIYKAITKIKFI